MLICIYLKGKYVREVMLWILLTRIRKLKGFVRMPKQQREPMAERWQIKYISV